MRSLFPRRSELAFTKPFFLSFTFLLKREDERFENNTNARVIHSSDERERERERENAPVYCSTSDFTHPLSPSSNVSKNAAPSNFCSFPFAAEIEDPVETNATVATVAIVFNPPILFMCAVFDR